MQKTNNRFHNCGSKGKGAKYYIANKEVLKEKVKNKYRNLPEEEKEAKKEYGKNRYENMK